MMRIVSTLMHGIYDYCLGVFLIISPWLLGFAFGGIETWIPIIAGLAVILYSLFTDYELGLVQRVEMPNHLGFEMAIGAVLAISPWLFGFADLTWTPHVVFGLITLATPLFTKTQRTYTVHGHVDPRHAPGRRPGAS